MWSHKREENDANLQRRPMKECLPNVVAEYQHRLHLVTLEMVGCAISSVIKISFKIHKIENLELRNYSVNYFINY